MISISTQNVGNCFGTVGVFRAGSRKVTTDVLGFGCEGAARQQAYELAVRAGLVREIGEVSECSERVREAAHRAGVTILLDRYAVVEAECPLSDEIMCSRFEHELQA